MASTSTWLDADSQPEVAPIGIPWSQFPGPSPEEFVEQLIEDVRPKRSSLLPRETVIEYVSRVIENCFSAHGVQVRCFVFGSVPLKTYLPDGDIDICIFQSSGQPVQEQWSNILHTAFLAETASSSLLPTRVQSAEVINAEVKLVKCVVDNIVVDISFNSYNGLCTLVFLEDLDQRIGSNHLFKRSVILVKGWCCYDSRLLGAQHALLSTYALETLVLAVFNAHGRSLTSPLEVFMAFLKMFSTFDFSQYCLSIQGIIPLDSFPNEQVVPFPDLEGAPYLDELFGEAGFLQYSVQQTPGWDRPKDFRVKKGHMHILDPLAENNNLGKSVSLLSTVRFCKAVQYAYEQLSTALSPGCDEGAAVDCLRRVFSGTLAASVRAAPQFVELSKESHKPVLVYPVNAQESEDGWRPTDSAVYSHGVEGPSYGEWGSYVAADEQRDEGGAHPLPPSFGGHFGNGVVPADSASYRGSERGGEVSGDAVQASQPGPSGWCVPPMLPETRPPYLAPLRVGDVPLLPPQLVGLPPALPSPPSLPPGNAPGAHFLRSLEVAVGSGVPSEAGALPPGTSPPPGSRGPPVAFLYPQDPFPRPLQLPMLAYGQTPGLVGNGHLEAWPPLQPPPPPTPYPYGQHPPGVAAPLRGPPPPPPPPREGLANGTLHLPAMPRLAMVWPALPAFEPVGSISNLDGSDDHEDALAGDLAALQAGLAEVRRLLDKSGVGPPVTPPDLSRGSTRSNTPQSGSPVPGSSPQHRQAHPRAPQPHFPARKTLPTAPPSAAILGAALHPVPSAARGGNSLAPVRPQKRGVEAHRVWQVKPASRPGHAERDSGPQPAVPTQVVDTADEHRGVLPAPLVPPGLALPSSTDSGIVGRWPPGLRPDTSVRVGRGYKGGSLRPHGHPGEILGASDTPWAEQGDDGAMSPEGALPGPLVDTYALLVPPREDSKSDTGAGLLPALRRPARPGSGKAGGSGKGRVSPTPSRGRLGGVGQGRKLPGPTTNGTVAQRSTHVVEAMIRAQLSSSHSPPGAHAESQTAAIHRQQSFNLQDSEFPTLDAGPKKNGKPLRPGRAV